MRLGKVEATESSESDDISLRVFVGKRVASVSATAASDPHELAERAVAMARGLAGGSRIQGLADPARLAKSIRDLDLFDDAEVSAERLKEDALAAEDAALAVKGVTNSGGSGASAGLGGLVLATSHGFLGQYVGSRFSRSASVIAGEGTGDGARLRLFLAPAFRRSRRAGRASAARPASAPCAASMRARRRPGR